MSKTRGSLCTTKPWPLAEGWSLTPEGAALHREAGVAVIADVHLGYEWSRGSGGDCLPAHSLAETLAKLEVLLARAALSKLIVAGDLVESGAPCLRTERDVQALAEWLALRDVQMIALRGNHDDDDAPEATLPETFEVAGWTIAHGDRTLRAPRRILGHYHPALHVGGRVVPCFLVGEKTIVLPAFSPNAAGLDMRARRLPRSLGAGALRRLAFAGEELLDFGEVGLRNARVARRSKAAFFPHSPSGRGLG